MSLLKSIILVLLFLVVSWGLGNVALFALSWSLDVLAEPLYLIFTSEFIMAGIFAPLLFGSVIFALFLVMTAGGLWDT